MFWRTFILVVLGLVNVVFFARMVWGRHFDQELNTLKDYLHQVDQMNLAEEDVTRLEKATATFLAELRLSAGNGSQPQRLLQ